jgi:hypothetical protein
VKWVGVTVVAAAVVAFVAAVVVLTRPDEPTQQLADADLAWVSRYEPWRISTAARLQTAYDHAAFVTTKPELDALIRPLRGCARSYAAIGPVPVALADVDMPSARACEIVRTIEVQSRQASTVVDDLRKTRLKAAAVALASAHARLLDHFRLANALEGSNDPSKSRVEPMLSTVATDLASANVEVRCWSAADWPEVRRELRALAPERGTPETGAAGVWSGAAQLSPSVCNRLLAVGTANAADEPDAGVRALDTLGHAVSHATGTEREVAASCDGLQAVRPLATDLGLSEDAAHHLAARAWELYRDKRLGVWSPDCRQGGPLDRDLSDAWP